jgi:hypothetical protein
MFLFFYYSLFNLKTSGLYRDCLKRKPICAACAKLTHSFLIDENMKVEWHRENVGGVCFIDFESRTRFQRIRIHLS